jgi:hypothetical protein
VAREGGAGIEPRVPSSGALRTEAATVAAIRPTRGVFAIIDCPGSRPYTRTSENSVLAKFAFWAFSEVRRFFCVIEHTYCLLKEAYGALVA